MKEMVCQVKQGKNTKKLNRAQKYSILGPQNLPPPDLHLRSGGLGAWFSGHMLHRNIGKSQLVFKSNYELVDMTFKPKNEYLFKIY